jgi:hypothetical protein
MAENESLDLRNPGGKRWIDVVDGVKKKQSPEIVAHKASRKLIAALRKAFKEFLDAGVTFEGSVKFQMQQRRLVISSVFGGIDGFASGITEDC